MFGARARAPTLRAGAAVDFPPGARCARGGSRPGPDRARGSPGAWDVRMKSSHPSTWMKSSQCWDEVLPVLGIILVCLATMGCRSQAFHRGWGRAAC